MKRTHLILLVITVVMALSSAYSLAAINQVYKTNFEWYSQFNKTYKSDFRDTSMDSWQLQEYPEKMQFNIIRNSGDAANVKKGLNSKDTGIPAVDFNKYILLDCRLGEVNSPDYRIKVVSIAERGIVVEVKVSVNSPPPATGKNGTRGDKYFPVDTVRIEKSAFPIKGKMCFIFKNQDGIKLYETYADIR